MFNDGAGIVLLEVLGQLYWRLGDLNGAEFEELKTTLNNMTTYRSLVDDPESSLIAMKRLKVVQRSKSRAFDEFERELEGMYFETAHFENHD